MAEAEQAEREGGNHPGVPDDKAQRNFTDPDSRIMPGPGGRDFQQSYNCPVVDSSHQVIVAARATDQPSDKRQAVMVEETIGNVDRGAERSIRRRRVLLGQGGGWAIRPEWTRSSRRRRPATAGCWSQRPGPHTQGPGHPGTGCPPHRCVRSGAGSATRWMETVEPVFGQIKQGRGFRQFLLRGLEKVNSEWSLICTGHNLVKLFRFGEGKPGKARATGPAGNNRDWHGTATRGIFRLDSVHLSAPHQDGGRRLVPPVSLPVSYSSDGLLGRRK